MRLTFLSLLAPCSVMRPMTGKLLPTTHMGKQWFITPHKAELRNSMTVIADVVRVPALNCSKPQAKGTSGLMLL